MPFSAILLVFKFLMFSFLQVCKFTDLQVHNSIDCPYFYGLSVKISDLLHLFKAKLPSKFYKAYLCIISWDPLSVSLTCKFLEYCKNLSVSRDFCPHPLLIFDPRRFAEIYKS